MDPLVETSERATMPRMAQQREQLPDCEWLLTAERHIQHLVPGAVLVGGTDEASPMSARDCGLPASTRVSINSQTNARVRSPGNEFPGSVDPSRLKPTANVLSESPLGDFFPTQPGNSFPGVGPPPAFARKSTVSNARLLTQTHGCLPKPVAACARND